MQRRRCARAAALWASLSLLGAATGAEKPPIPVILDTDIGDDIDDTWALGFLLKAPELDLRLVVGDQGKARYRAAIIAKMLQRAGRTDVAVGIGLEVNATGGGGQSPWVEGYDLAKYPGTVHKDGVQAIIDTIMQSKEPVTLIAIGPLPNVAAALAREPRIATKARFVGMHGSVRKGYGGRPTIDAEYNVKADPKACRTALSAAWDITITPLDTCGLVTLRGEKYARVKNSKDPIATAIIENYRVWSDKDKKAPEERSSVLFDTVAVYLAFSTDFTTMETLGIRVSDDGKTLLDPAAKAMRVATEWKNLGAFEDLLVARLTGPSPARPAKGDQTLSAPIDFGISP